MEGWIIVTDAGKIFYESFRPDRLRSIKYFIEGRLNNWKFYYNKGYRCKRVVLKFD